MKRRLNSTGRKRIPLELVPIRLNIGSPVSFDANLARLSELGLRPDAQVYVEAYVNSSSMRFHFGSVVGITPPPERSLTEIDVGGHVLFRVKVVDETGDVGRILASAKEIRPADGSGGEDDEKSILPLRTKDLGEAVWSVDIEGAARPELWINSRIPDLAEQIKTNPLMQGAILPYAIKRVLEAALLSESVDDSLEWVQDWRKFASAMRGEELPTDQDDETAALMIQDVVDRYVLRMKFATRAATPIPLPRGFHD
jgi:hypothetical protein